MAEFSSIIDHLGQSRIGFEDFRRNGLLLPSRDSTVVRTGLPLHRGPHRHYNSMVIERVGEIDRVWRHGRAKNRTRAAERALGQLAQLQDRLRKSLLNPGSSPLLLHSKDPLGCRYDYRELDAMADQLWRAT